MTASILTGLQKLTDLILSRPDKKSFAAGTMEDGRDEMDEHISEMLSSQLIRAVWWERGGEVIGSVQSLLDRGACVHYVDAEG